MKTFFYCLIINKIQIQYGRDRTPANYATFSSGILKASLYTKKIYVTSGTFHSYTMRKGYMAILHHAIENIVARWEGWV